MLNQLKIYFCLHKKFLLYNLVARNLKIKYRESFLGYLWTMVIPLCQTGIFYFLYSMVFKVDIPNYLLFLVCGLLPWFFFSATLSESMEGVGGNGALLNQMPIPIQVFSNMSAITNMVNLLAALPIMIFIYLRSQIEFQWQVLLVFPFLISLYIMALAIGNILSIIYVYFRDLRHITNLVLQIWFYATPVVYAKDMIPARMADILIYANPVASWFIILRSLILAQPVDLNLLMLNLCWTAGLFVLSFWVIKKFGHGLVERL